MVSTVKGLRISSEIEIALEQPIFELQRVRTVKEIGFPSLYFPAVSRSRGVTVGIDSTGKLGKDLSHSRFIIFFLLTRAVDFGIRVVGRCTRGMVALE